LTRVPRFQARLQPRLRMRSKARTRLQKYQHGNSSVTPLRALVRALVRALARSMLRCLPYHYRVRPLNLASRGSHCSSRCYYLPPLRPLGMQRVPADAQTKTPRSERRHPPTRREASRIYSPPRHSCDRARRGRDSVASPRGLRRRPLATTKSWSAIRKSRSRGPETSVATWCAVPIGQRGKTRRNERDETSGMTRLCLQRKSRILHNLFGDNCAHNQRADRVRSENRVNRCTRRVEQG
jgi:hypothetical protein